MVISFLFCEIRVCKVSGSGGTVTGGTGDPLLVVLEEVGGGGATVLLFISFCLFIYLFIF